MKEKDIKFWAGTTFENRANAPFILGDMPKPRERLDEDLRSAKMKLKDLQDKLFSLSKKWFVRGRVLDGVRTELIDIESLIKTTEYGLEINNIPTKKVKASKKRV